jgi:hypothetical protein
MVVDHIAEPVETALYGKELFRLHLRCRGKVVALPPGEMGIRHHRNFVGVTQIQRPRIGILWTALNKHCSFLGHRHMQRLAAKDEKIPAMLEIIFYRSPGIRRHGRAVGEHQQLGLVQSARGI